MNEFLSAQEKQDLTQQIRQAEARCDAELVTVIASTSDNYTFIPVLWAALAALSVPGLYFLFTQTGVRSWIPLDTQVQQLQAVYVLQVLLFLLLVWLFRWQPLLMRLIPAGVKRRRAHRHAQSQFLQHGVHHTQSRGGVLLFVSVAEHYVEIIADKGVAAAIDDARWEQIIVVFSNHLRQDQVALGFQSAINSCGDLLHQHFPASDKNSDELPNHLIEI